MNEFILSDETVTNSYGFRVLNAGGRFERFNDNPVMLLYHNHEKVAGKWLGLHIKGKNLLATPEFDEGDNEAKDAQRKVERGYLKGASIGIIPLKWEYALKEDGSTDITLTEWELLEASIVSVPSNRAALKLYHPDTMQEMTEKELQLSIENLKNNKNKSKMNEQITLTADAANALGIGVNPASGRDLSASVMELHAAKEKAEKELKALKDAATLAAKTAAETLVNTAITEGRLTADKRDAFVTLATTNYSEAKIILDSMPKPNSLSSTLQPSGNKDTKLTGIPADRANWTYKDWQAKDLQGLQKLKTDVPDAFAGLYSAHMESLKNK